jgi:hypothetical protein
MNDPAYRQILLETLDEIRGNVHRMGREEAVRSFGDIVEAVGTIKNGPNEVMLVAVMFELADFHARLALVEEYATTVATNTLLLSQGDMEAASVAAQKARELKSRITGQL